MPRDNKQPYFRFYASDWLAGTRGMTAVEIGVYITLIATMYEHCGPVSGDSKRLSRMCGCTPATFAKVVTQLISDGKLIRNEKGFWNKRVEKEFAFREEKSQAGEQAAKKRWEKTQRNQRSSDADAMQTQCDRNAKPEARSQKPDKPPKSPKGTNEFEGFAEWYEAYPRKQGRPKANAAYGKALQRADANLLLEKAVELAACFSQPGEDIQYCPHPATWLNQDRWADKNPKAREAAGTPDDPVMRRTRLGEMVPCVYDDEGKLVRALGP